MNKDNSIFRVLHLCALLAFVFGLVWMMLLMMLGLGDEFIRLLAAIRFLLESKLAK